MKANTNTQDNKQSSRSAANETTNGKGIGAMPPAIQLQSAPPAQMATFVGDETDGPSQITGPGASVSVADGIATISAPFVKIASPHVITDGVLQSDTLITNSVVASSYTPGAGNVM
jgi:hypothetical protein